MRLPSRLYLFTPLVAVVTLPAGVLAGLFYGPLPAAVVFVVGWLLLVPVTAILFGGAMMTGPMTNEFEAVTDAELQAVLGDGEATEPTDPSKRRGSTARMPRRSSARSSVSARSTRRTTS